MQQKNDGSAKQAAWAAFQRPSGSRSRQSRLAGLCDRP